MSDITFLQLLQLADTALPIGATAHSLGLETLIAEEKLTPPHLEAFFHDYISETGGVEGLYCRLAHQSVGQADFAEQWFTLNSRLSALKPARESRTASITLGRRLLQLVASLESHAGLTHALGAEVESHHATAFGLVGAILGVAEQLTVLAYLQQSVAGLVSACQRLLPLGQRQATSMMWRLKPTLVATAEKSGISLIEGEATYSCAPLLEMGGARHPNLRIRLFIS